jgi:hypothetical protein
MLKDTLSGCPPIGVEGAREIASFRFNSLKKGQPIVFATRLAIIILLTLVCSSASQAQIGGASLHGQVVDPSDGVVAKATVVVTTPDGHRLRAITNRQGEFELKGLAPGNYKVEVIAKGFAIYANESVQITAGQVQNLSVSLRIEEQKQQVEVSDNPAAGDVNLMNNGGGIVISGEQLDALPDDPDELQTDLESLAGPSAGPSGGQFYIDGFTGGRLPPKSAIREIRINQDPFSAEYDKVGYGRVEIFTKPGSDQWHGQISINGNDSAFNSKNPFAPSKVPYYSTQYSGSVGGPLSKKASLFFNVDEREAHDLTVVNAQIVNSANQVVPFSESLQNPRRGVNMSPRLDYQLTKNNTLSVRYQYSRDDNTNNGVGGFTLASQGYNSLNTEHSLQVSDTQVFGTRIVNETRFQYLRDGSGQIAQSTAPTILVPSAFNGGGSSAGNLTDDTNHYEFQNYTSVQFTKHLLKFGARLRGLTDANNSTAGFNGSYIFPSIQAYQQTLLGQEFFASQYFVTGIPNIPSIPQNPRATVSQVDVGVYVEDDWRVRPNITLSYGLRFESQNNISDHADWAPRLGFAWGICGGGKTRPKAVVRAGFGIFYDRFEASNVLQADRLNGTREAQFIVTNPNFFLNPPAALPSVPATLQTTYQIDHNLRAPYLMESAVSLETQLTKSATLKVSYLNSRGWGQLLLNNINTPLPGTIIRPYYLNPTTGTRPSGDAAGNIYQYESEGIFRQNQLFVQTTIRAGAKLMLFGYYVLNYANGDSSGAGSFPSNPYNILQDYGRASFDIRNRATIGGSIALPYGLRLSPFMVASSGSPYNISLSQDLIGSSQFNQRPAFASGLSNSADVVTVPGFGSFDTVPQPGEKLVPVNILTGSNRFTFNLRLAKTFGFGKEIGGQNGNASGPHGSMGGVGSGTDQRYKVTFSVNARNAFNNVNLATPSAVLSPPTATSPASFSSFFGVSNALAGGSSSSNRQIYLQASFSF